MDRRVFQKSLGKAFYPSLRQAGFVGSGVTRRRYFGPIIQVVNVQGSQWGGGCYVNLGIHVKGLATAGGGTPTDVPKEYQCIIRTRLDPPPDIGHGIWPYGSAEVESSRVAESMTAEFTSRGEAFFGKAARWPEDFTALVAGEGRALRVEGLNLARLARHLSMTDEAKRIAQQLLEAAPSSATALRAAIQEFLESCEAA